MKAQSAHTPRSNTRRSALRLALAVTVGTSFATIARATETINVAFVSGFPPNATFVAAFNSGFAPAVDKVLAKTGNYKVRWNFAHSGQIAKPRGELEALQGGLADIAAVPGPYHFDRAPMLEVVYQTPFSGHDAAQMSDVFQQMEKKFPQIQQGWAKLNQRVLVATANADSYILVLTKPARTVAELKGVKIGAVGPNSPWLQYVGATPVQAAMADWYTGMNTGVYQGAMTPPQALGAFKLCQAGKYVVDAGLGASGIINLNVNLAFWNKLPAEVKQAFEEAAPVYNKEQLRILFEGSKEAMELCRKQYGMVEISFSPEERARWAKGMPNIAQEWAQRMEKQGLPGKEVLTFYMDAMRASKQPIARHWDRE